jgi:hypothetical protein
MPGNWVFTLSLGQFVIHILDWAYLNTRISSKEEEWSWIGKRRARHWGRGVPELIRIRLEGFPQIGPAVPH